MDIDEIKDALRQRFFTVFLDGRNEHGSHVLQMAGDNISDGHDQIISDTQDQSTGLAEQIIAEAEGAGFKINHCVVTV